MTEYVTLTELAEEFGICRSNTRKYVLRAGFNPIRVRTEDSRGQKTLALTQEDAETVRQLRAEEGFLGKQIVSSDNDKGWFYIIQVVPDLDPNRVKLGFANDVEVRLRAHRTAAPTATLVRKWSCKKSWETAAIASITRMECESLSYEVFICEDSEALVNRSIAFFALMPGVGNA